MTTLLLTAFEPFDGEAINPSLEVARLLDGAKIGDATVIAKALPCVFGESIEVLEEAIVQIKPDIIISLGQAGGRSDITPERVAINLDDARIPDNVGKQPIDKPIIEGGAPAYFTTLPVKAMVQSLQQAGVPASVSYSAGTYVCNHVFYGLQTLAEKYNIKQSGFVHIPYLPEQAVNHAGKPSMSSDTLVKGLRTMIEAVLDNETDISVIGGKTH